MNTQQVARAGEMFVAAEIHRRGGYAVTFAGNMPGIDILASDLADTPRPFQDHDLSPGMVKGRSMLRLPPVAPCPDRCG